MRRGLVDRGVPRSVAILTIDCALPSCPATSATTSTTTTTCHHQPQHPQQQQPATTDGDNNVNDEEGDPRSLMVIVGCGDGQKKRLSDR